MKSRVRSRKPFIIADGWSVEPRRDDPFLQGVLRRRMQNDVAIKRARHRFDRRLNDARLRLFAQDLLCVPAHTAAEWICATVDHDVMRSKEA